MFPVDLTFNQTIFWPIFLANNPFLGHFRTGLLLDIPTGRKNRLNYCIDWRVNSRHPFIVVSILIRFSVSYQHLKISIPWDARSPQCTKHSWRLHFVTYVTSLFWCRKNPYRWWTHQNIYIYIKTSMFDAKSPVQPFHLMAASSFHSLVFTQIGCCELHPMRQGQCAVATSLLRQPLRHAWSRCVSGVSFFRAGEMATRTHLETSHSLT